MTIDALPTTPNSQNPTTFAANMDAFLAALVLFRTQANALGTTADANASTSTTKAGEASTSAATATAKALLTAADAVATAADKAAAAASAASAAAIAGAFVGTSTTSWTPALGSKTFATQSGEQYTAGVTLSIVSASTPSVWGAGQVTSYSGTSLVMDITVIGTASAKTDWNISLCGVQGPQGATGAESLPSASAGGTADAITATFSPAITLADQQKCCVVLGYANATTTPTFAPNGLTAHTITKTGGAALAAGDLPGASAAALLIYNLANTRWELMNPAVAGILELLTPTNITPISAATGQGLTPTLTGTAFNSNYGATHSATQVQISTSSSFASPLYTSGDQAASTSFTVPGATLTLSLTPYYWRIRYKNSRGNYSSWSDPTTFVTDGSLYIATPTATPAAFGDAFEGGFYTGLIWNELIESSTSVAIGTGSKTFTVAASAAYCYAGQALEIRSRADPTKKMVGTVTGANLSTLIVNVTSVGGSGTYTDWSVMAQYRVIVAPKASGENSSIAYKNANSAAPSACGTLTEGKKATDAMVAADTSTVYPAAWWCHNLSIGGKTDWYLPARDELELAWRNLKPTADANYTTANRATGATPDYKNLGSYGDTANTHGLNNNSSPAGAAYSSGTPAQVAAGKNFRTGESEAFAYGSYDYWSASEYSTTHSWFQDWLSGYPGYQNGNGKTYAYYVRAVRRSII